MKKLAFLALVLLIAASAKQLEGFDRKIDITAIAALEKNTDVPVIILFKNGTSKSAQMGSVAAMASSFSVKRQYSLLNMMAGKANERAIEALRNNPNVERVYYDYEVRLIEPVSENIAPMMQDTVPLIGASNITVNNVSINGTGIKVAIIDTGVNYSHPDLGNCTTAQFLNGTCSKVVDGYDFYSNDNDPMDQNRHGTHVAGTVAANGALRGVAPGAQIIAVKVFPASGGASTSDIIAGMEFSVLRGANIVSLSLGGTEVPHNGKDIMALAADALSNRALFIIAAGNSYSLGSIGSPGLSAQAITVGATDKSDSMASFSSRGGTSDGRIDPDIVAPGVSINSTYYLGGYLTLSGTSMATPHVAGAAALVMQANPTWSVSRVKQALVNTAKDLGFFWKNQGSGRLNASEAVTNKIWVSPNYLQTEQYPGTTRTLLLNITNENNASISINLSASNMTKLEWTVSGVYSPPAILSGNVTFNATSFSISANSTATIQVNITVPSASEAGQWEGFIYVSTNRSIAVPLALSVPANASFVGSVYFSQVDIDVTDSSAGDWQFYKFYVNNTAYQSIDVNVSWNYTGSDVDFYIIDPKGTRFSAIADSTTFTFENRTITDIVPGEYLVEVHAYSINASTDPLNITGIITYAAYAALSPNDTVDFGYVYPNATKTVSINLTNTGASNLTINATNTALVEQWSRFTTIASSALSYNTSFSLNANSSIVYNITLNASSASSGTYWGSIVHSYGSGNLTLPIKVVVLLPNSTLNLTFSEYVAGVITYCNAANPRPHRALHLNASRQNLVGFSTRLNWSSDVNMLAAVLIDPAGNAYNFSTGSDRIINFTIAPASGIWSYEFCYGGIAGITNSYTLNVENLYNTRIQTYSDASFSTLSSFFAPGQTVYYKVFVLDANNASVNVSANITIFDPSNASANTTTNVYLGGNYTANYTLQSNATNGTWRIVAYPAANAVQNETSFDATQNPTLLSLPVGAAYRLNDNITIIASVRDQAGNPIPGQNITLNITNSSNATVFSATNQSNSSGFSSFYLPINVTNATDSYAANATSGNLSNSSTFLVQQLSQILLNLSASAYSPGAAVFYNITLFSTAGAQMLTNETINVTLLNPNNATNQSSLAYVTGNASLNLTLDPFATNGNWTLRVNDTYFSISNSSTFFVNTTYNATMSVANYSVAPNATATIYVNITNTGNTNNTFYVNFTRSADWATNMTNLALNFTPGQSANLPFNFSVPFADAGTLNTVSVTLASLYGNLSANAIFLLNVSAVYNFTMAANVSNVSSVTNFSLPDAVSVLITLQSFSNANDTILIRTSANASGWNATPLDQNVSLNQSQQRNVTITVNVPSSASGSVKITVNATSNSNATFVNQVNITFAVPTITITAASPVPANMTYYPMTYYPSTYILNFTFTASDVDGSLSASNLTTKTCTFTTTNTSITVNASGTGTTLYCQFSWLGSSLPAQANYAINISLKDFRNHSGSTLIYAGIHRTMTVNISNPGSLTTGQSFFIDGNAFYGSGYGVTGSITITIGSASTLTGTVSGGYYHVAAVAPSTAGTYTITSTVLGVWGISNTETRAISVTAPATTGGGGGGGAPAPAPAQNITAQPSIISTQAAAGQNTTFSLNITNTYATAKNVTINATEAGNTAHFDITYPNVTAVSANSTGSAQITITPFKYARPGNYTVSIAADNSTKTVTVSIPAPAPVQGTINVNRYVELSRAQNESYMYLEIVNRRNETANLTVRETIPKNVSNSTEGIAFRPNYTRLADDDPVVEWDLLLAPNESKELNYTINRSVKNIEFPEPNITVLALVNVTAPGLPANVTPANITPPGEAPPTVVVGEAGRGLDIGLTAVIIIVVIAALAFAFKDVVRKRFIKRPKVFEPVAVKRAPPVFEIPPSPEERKKEEGKAPAVYEEVKP